MKRGLTFSVFLHLAVIVLAIYGLPELVRERPLEDRLMVVEVMTVGAVTNAPPPSEQAKKPDAPTQNTRAKPDAPRTPPPPQTSAPPPPPTPKIDPPKVEAPKVEVPKTEPPKPQTERPTTPATVAPKAEPAPTQQSVAKAEPVPQPKPKPQEAKPPVPDAEAIPLPKPKPQEVKKPEPQPEAPKPTETAKPEPPKPEPPKPEQPKPEPPKAQAAKPEPEAVKAADATPAPAPPVPVSRPTPPKQQVAKATPEKKPEDKKPEPDDFMNVLKSVQKMKETASQPAEAQNAPKTADSTARSNFDADRPLSVSEMDAIRQQIARCWLVPAGAKEGATLLVEIRVRMNADRTVRDAQIVDTARMSEPFFRAAAESALRALRNPSCTPLNLPPEKFDTWKSFTITFDPKDMLS